MNIDFDWIDDCLVARVRDRRLEAASAADFKQRIGAHLDEPRRMLVIELSAVDFIDSTGLGAILSLLKRAAGALVLSGCRPPVLELLKLTRLDRALRIAPTLDNAMAAVAVA